MGILKENKKEEINILTENGFEYGDHSIDYDLHSCYEKCVKLSEDENSYYAWVSVNICNGDVHIYVEYDCGGKIASIDTNIDVNFEENQQEFFEKLDEEVTELLKSYM